MVLFVRLILTGAWLSSLYAIGMGLLAYGAASPLVLRTIWSRSP